MGLPGRHASRVTAVPSLSRGKGEFSFNQECICPQLLRHECAPTVSTAGWTSNCRRAYSRLAFSTRLLFFRRRTNEAIDSAHLSLVYVRNSRGSNLTGGWQYDKTYASGIAGGSKCFCAVARDEAGDRGTTATNSATRPAGTESRSADSAVGTAPGSVSGHGKGIRKQGRHGRGSLLGAGSDSGGSEERCR